MTGILARARAFTGTWEFWLALFAIAVVVVAAFVVPGFTGPYNLESSISRMAARALLVLPLALLIIAREIDISVGSVGALAGITLGLTFQAGAPGWLAVLAAIAVGAACGALNGALVTVIGMPSLIATLGTMALFRGLCYILVGGTPVSPLPEEVVAIGTRSIPGSLIPYSILPFVVLVVVAWIVLHHTALGRRIFAIGGSPEVARYSGIANRRHLMGMFIASGLVAGVAGVLHSGMTSSASPDAMFGFELDAITVVFLGGVSFLGGVGTIGGVLAGLVIVASLRSALQLLNVAAFTQAAAIGTVLIGSLLVSRGVTAAVARRRQRLAAAAPPTPVPTP